MSRTTFKNLLAQHDLPSSFIYLAPIFPIVQVMWADGRNQIPERVKLTLLIEDHCRALSEMVGGVEPVSRADREKFDLMFVANKPDLALLNEFSEVATQSLNADGFGSVEDDDGRSLNSSEALIAACMEIAAACATKHPLPENDMTQKRIVEEERDLIVKAVEILRKGA